MSRDLERLAARVAHLERQLSRGSRSAQLAYSSVEDGAIEVHDEGGRLTGVIGVQPDGTTGVVIVNGAPPPTPTPALLGAVLGGVSVRWDGAWTDSIAAPLDFARVEIHASPVDGFTPGPSTLRSTMESPRGGLAVIATRGPLHVRLVARNTSGTAGPASVQTGPAGAALVAGPDLDAGSVTAGKIAAGSVETPHLSVGAVLPEHSSVGTGINLIPDPGFEGAATANALAAAGAPWGLAPGNRTGTAVHLDLSSEAPSYYTLPLAAVPVLPSAQFQLGVEVLVSEDYAAQSVKIFARWEDERGAVLGYGVAEALAPVRGAWHRITGQVAAPQGATRAVLCLEASAATAGTVAFDNAEAIAMFGRVGGGARAEVGPRGLRLLDEDDEEAVALLSGMPQFLTLRSDGVPVATIDDLGNAGFRDVNAAGTLTVGGTTVEDLLDSRARGILAIDYQGSSVTGGTTEMGFVEVAFTAESGRLYRVVYDGVATPSAAGGEVQLRLRDGGAALPTIGSPQLQMAAIPLVQSGGRRVRLETVRPGPAFGPGLHRLLLTFRCQGGPAGQTVALSGGATSPGLCYVEDVGPYVPETGGYNPGNGGAADPVRAHTGMYVASWSGTYAQRDGYNASRGSACVQGYAGPVAGMEAALIGFPATLATDLAGAAVQRAQLYLYAEHWAQAAGGQVAVKSHHHAARPARFSADLVELAFPWNRNTGRWVDITSIFDPATWRGVALDPNTAGAEFYGRVRGAASANPPRLKVHYTK
ncbi:hypothetical protein ACIQXD_29605 [Streptomyces uncialis]|uniref:hypothetical protein n=1 Tax=Streptomyces uncialis TaxID=1048205 RepID=UPI00380BCF74